MFLIYNKCTKIVESIVDTLPIELNSNYVAVPTNDFSINDLEKYNITVKTEDTILSELKPLAERKAIQLEKEKENQQQGIELSEREINEIAQGIQISELEIQLLELQLGGM